MTGKPPPLDGDSNRDANIKASKRRGLLITGLHYFRQTCYRAPASAVGCTESDAHSYGGAGGGAGGVGDPLKVYAYISGKEKRVKIQETALRFCRTCLRSI